MKYEWQVEETSDGWRVRQSNMCWVADVYGGRDPQANARLIAAAPQMLEALKTISSWDGDPDSWHSMLKKVELALEKAAGDEE